MDHPTDRIAFTQAIVASLAVVLGASSAAGGLVNRWSFDEPGGVTVMDSVGGAHGVIKGEGASLSGGRLMLPGGPSASAAYVDLPNGLISRFSDATLEGWATVDGAQAWARLFDFGSTAGGEIDGPGGGGAGQDYLALAASHGININQQRLEIRNLDTASGGTNAGSVGSSPQTLDTDHPTTLGETFHFAAVYDASAGELRHYRNGILEGSLPVTIELGNLSDVNNWLGRSNWTADANLQGSLEEFRIYDTALNDAQVAASFTAGPNTLVPEPAAFVGASAMLVAAATLTFARRRFRNHPAGKG